MDAKKHGKADGNAGTDSASQSQSQQHRTKPTPPEDSRLQAGVSVKTSHSSSTIKPFKASPSAQTYEAKHNESSASQAPVPAKHSDKHSRTV
jgi:hypothetical protein